MRQNPLPALALGPAYRHATPAPMSPSHPTTSATRRTKTRSARGKTASEIPLNDKPDPDAIPNPQPLIPDQRTRADRANALLFHRTPQRRRQTAFLAQRGAPRLDRRFRRPCHRKTPPPTNTTAASSSTNTNPPRPPNRTSLKNSPTLPGASSVSRSSKPSCCPKALTPKP